MSNEKIKVLIPQLPSADAIMPYLRRIDENRTQQLWSPYDRTATASAVT